MNSDEVNNLLAVMQKKINELTSQNIMLEAKVIYLNNMITATQKQPLVSDGGSFDDKSETPTKELTKSRRSV
jgi:hypothetical protein